MGGAARGKTPFGICVAMAMTHFWKDSAGLDDAEPCFRLASDIDFLRVVIGAITCVDILDDCDSKELLIKKIKAFLDISLA